MRKIGFIGIGTMGTPMVRNLLKAGYELIIHDRATGKAEQLVELGAKVASSPKDVAKECEVVITMLPADQGVRDVVTGPNGIAEGGAAGLVVIDSSTVLPATSKQMAAELARFQIEMLDAPVTGSEPQAVEGKLTFIVGGKGDIYEKCRPLFNAMGKASFHMGSNGAGSYTKLSNNTISAISLVAFA